MDASETAPCLVAPVSRSESYDSFFFLLLSFSYCFRLLGARYKAIWVSAEREREREDWPAIRQTTTMGDGNISY